MAASELIRLDLDGEAPLKARRWVDRTVHGLPKSRRHDLRLLTHELVANSLKHSDGEQVWISVEETDEGVTVEVRDEGALTEPAPLPAQEFATSGNGLRWVATLSDAWEAHPKRVWFRLDLPLEGGS